MKKLFLAFCSWFTVVSCAAESEVNMELEIDIENQSYRVVLGGEGDQLAYDSVDFEIPQGGLAPIGAKLHFMKSDGDLLILPDGTDGYSSYSLYSGDPFPRSKMVHTGENGYVSEWYALVDLKRGIDKIKTVESLNAVSKISVSFSVKTSSNAEYLEARSSWVDVPLGLFSEAN